MPSSEEIEALIVELQRVNEVLERLEDRLTALEHPEEPYPEPAPGQEKDYSPFKDDG